MNTLKTLGAIAGAIVAFAGSSHAQVVSTPYFFDSVLNEFSPTFHRPQSFTTLSSLGTRYAYSALSFIPSVSGEYNLASVGANLTGLNSTDTFYAIYAGSLNPADPLAGLIAYNNNYNGTFLSENKPMLVGGSLYTLVSTTFNENAYGTINNRILGPGGSTLNLGGTSAPEPGSLALLSLVALPGVALLRRRK